MNILSFDIEEWYIEKVYHGARREKYAEFESYLDKILYALDEKQTKATFFCLGKVASDFPNIVKKIDAKGHEIGCHSDKHLWLTKLSREEVLTDTHNSIDALQQCVGRKVVSYRAPAFSIGENNKWAFEVLASCGIENDSSVFPTIRDFGGFPSFGSDIPSLINYNGILLKEFPIPIVSFLGKQVAYSGGGYFRFFPITYIKEKIKYNDYSMVYLHIGDLLSESKGLMSRADYETYFKESGTLTNRCKRYIKGNLGKKTAFSKFVELINSAEFMGVEQSAENIKWDSVPVVKL